MSDFDRGFLAGQESADRELDAAKDRVAELEADNEQLRGSLEEWRLDHASLEAEVEQNSASLDWYAERLGQQKKRAEKAEAERDRLAGALRKIQRTGRDEFHQNIARAALDAYLKASE